MTVKKELVPVQPRRSKEHGVSTMVGYVTPETLKDYPEYSFDGALFVRFADLKNAIKTLEEEAGLLQEKLLEEYPDLVKVEIPALDGTFSQSSRESWELDDAKKLLSKIGEKVFMSIVKVGKTDCVKAVGEVGFKNLVKAKIFHLSGTSTSFTWRRKAQKPAA